MSQHRGRAAKIANHDRHVGRAHKQVSVAALYAIIFQDSGNCIVRSKIEPHDDRRMARAERALNAINRSAADLNHHRYTIIDKHVCHTTWSIFVSATAVVLERSNMT